MMRTLHLPTWLLLERHIKIDYWPTQVIFQITLFDESRREEFRGQGISIADAAKAARKAREAAE